MMWAYSTMLPSPEHGARLSLSHTGSQQRSNSSSLIAQKWCARVAFVHSDWEFMKTEAEEASFPTHIDWQQLWVSILLDRHYCHWKGNKRGLGHITQPHITLLTCWPVTETRQRSEATCNEILQQWRQVLVSTPWEEGWSCAEFLRQCVLQTVIARPRLWLAIHRLASFDRYNRHLYELERRSAVLQRLGQV